MTRWQKHPRRVAPLDREAQALDAAEIRIENALDALRGRS